MKIERVILTPEDLKRAGFVFVDTASNITTEPEMLRGGTVVLPVISHSNRNSPHGSVQLD